MKTSARGVLRRSLRSFRILGLVLGACAVSAQGLATGTAEEKARTRDVWYAYSDGGQRYGSLNLRVTPTDGGFRYDVVERILIDPFALQRQEHRTVAEYTTTKELRPISMRVETQQLSGTTVLTGRLDGTTFTLASDRPGSDGDVVHEFEPGETVLFSSTLEDWMGQLDPETEPLEVQMIDYSTGGVVPVLVSAGRRDAQGFEWLLGVGGATESVTLAFDAQGQHVETRVATMTILERCTAAEAADLVFREITGREVLVFPMNRPIVQKNRLERLVVRLRWKDIPFEDFELEDARQRVIERKDLRSSQRATIEVTPTPAADDAATLPVSDPDLALYLAETEYIKPDDPAIRALALEVIGDETNARRAAAALSRWIGDNLRGEMIAETLSGPEVLACRKGKCTEYATLFASLARSVGIPARIALGERMVGDQWMGHAWNEAWVGRWIPVDSTVDEVGGSMELLKFIHSDTVAGTQPLRQALTQSLSISIREVELSPSPYGTGIEGSTYSNGDFGVRITAPSDEWTLEDKSTAREAVLGLEPDAPNSVRFHLLVSASNLGADPERILQERMDRQEPTLDEFVVHKSEPCTVAGVSGWSTHFEGRGDAGERLTGVDVGWVRGAVTCVLTLSVTGAGPEEWLDERDALLAGFEFLD